MAIESRRFRQTKRCRIACSAVGLLVSACRHDAPGSDAPVIPHAVAAHMPSVTRMPVTIANGDEPDIGFVGVAVAANGDIAYVSSRVVAPIIRVVDSTGRLIEAIGRLGDGPGEFRTPVHLWVRGDTLIATSRPAGIFAAYLMSGRFLREWHSGLTDVTLDLVGDSVDHFDPTRPLNGHVVEVRRVALDGGGDHGPTGSGNG